MTKYIDGRKVGRKELTPLSNLSHLVLQRWRVYGDDYKFKLSSCANCKAQFEEPATMNLMCCPLCANHLWKKKNYPPKALELDGPNTGCPWCGKKPRRGKYCDEWCREAKLVESSREYQRRKREQR